MRAANWLCGLLALGLLGYAGYRYQVDREPLPGPPLRVKGPDQDIGPQPGTADLPVRFRLKNVALRPIQILGLSPG